jgi:selenocysteine lyase/cysteine desulfurase
MTSDFSRESDSEKVARLRELIPATSAGIYLDTAYRGPILQETHAAMAEADEWELRVGRATEGRDEDMAQRVEEARAVIAALVGASPDEISLRTSRPPLGVTALVDANTGERLNPAGRDVDASFVAGVAGLSVRELGVDSLFIACDHWLLGPEATGAMWTRNGLPDLPASLARTAVLGLARSVGWLEMYVGLEWIYRRTGTLAGRLHDALSAISRVTVVTPRDALAGIIVFRLPGWPLESVLDELRRRAFAIIGPTPDGESVRASVAWFNTEEELDRFAAVVAEIARYTPETLPRRPLLVIQ